MNQMSVAASRLKDVYEKTKFEKDVREMLEHRDEVITRFQAVFNPEHLPALTAEEYSSFLRPKNNKHWHGINRNKKRSIKDMTKLRKALATLLDEERPIDQRLDEVFGFKIGIGKATATPILLVVYPHRYGVWNSVSEDALKKLGLWPSFERGETEGKKYLKINRVLNDLAREVGVDLWTLDALLWALENYS